MTHTKIDFTLRDNTPKDMYFNYKGNWIIRLNEKGIEFNREAFPDHKPEDFAKEFMEILENGFQIKFEKK